MLTKTDPSLERQVYFEERASDIKNVSFAKEADQQFLLETNNYF